MMDDESVSNVFDMLFQQEWFVDDWILSVIDLMNMPLDKEKVKALPLEKKIELMDFMAANLPDPEEN